MAQSNLTPALSPFSSEPFSSFFDSQLRSIDRMLGAPTLHCCEFEDEFGCGALATITDLESEREYCPRHFRHVSLDAALRDLEAQ